METTIAQSIRASATNAAYDASCKRVLSEKSILAWIMKTCLDEFRDCDVNDIEKIYIESEPQVGAVSVLPDETNVFTRIHGVANEDVTVTEGTISYDIRFFATAPTGDRIRLIINVEAQNDFYPGYPLIRRGIYYCSRMISAQYGTEFAKSQYDKIKKVYSVWICMNPPKNRENTITRYHMTEENLIGNVHERPENYDLLTTVMVCLGDSEKKNKNGLLELLNVLLSEKVGDAEKQQILEEQFKIEMTEKFREEVSTMCNLSKGVADKATEKATKNSELKSIRKMMEKLNMTSEEAMNVLDISESDRKLYREQLKEE